VPAPASNEELSFVLNERAAVQFGFTPQQMIGKTIIMENTPIKVVGVLRDFKFKGVREPVKPTAYYYEKDETNFVSVRVRPEDLSDTLTFIDKIWHSVAPNIPLQRWFLDDRFNRLYSIEQRQGTMFAIFTGIAIVIAC